MHPRRSFSLVYADTSSMFRLLLIISCMNKLATQFLLLVVVRREQCFCHRHLIRCIDLSRDNSARIQISTCCDTIKSGCNEDDISMTNKLGTRSLGIKESPDIVIIM